MLACLRTNSESKMKSESMKSEIKKIVKYLFSLFTIGLLPQAKQISDLLLLNYWQSLKANTLNPLNKYGAKYFSQNEEDGITLEIIRRLGIETGVFAEFGVGNGTENNSLILLAKGWKGLWVGGEDLCINYKNNQSNFIFIKEWVTRRNIVDIFQSGIKVIGEQHVDILSLDLDGNDYYLIEQLLHAGVSPKLFIVEYNSKFPPPIKWKIPYDENHVWGFDDYFGASLAEFDALMKGFGYSLVCCNFSGSNAFYVKNELMKYFDDIPKKIMDIFHASNYFVLQSLGHKPSSKTIELMIGKGKAT